MQHSTIYCIANWKTNPTTLAEVKNLAKLYTNFTKDARVTTVVCPPPVFQAMTEFSTITMGAQSVSFEKNATGTWTAMQLHSLGVQYCIVGHSERRSRGETDTMVCSQIKSLLSVGITPIICVGETERDDAGQYLKQVKTQIKNSCQGLTRADFESIIIAYEPVWSIGNAAVRACTTVECEEMSLFIKNEVIEMTGSMPIGKITIIYGGSVDAVNALDFLQNGSVDGLLVGRASLDPEQMSTIHTLCNTLHTH